MRVAIIGCGLIGNKRALALPQGWSLVLCCDQIRERAENLAHFHPTAQATTDPQLVTTSPGVDIGPGLEQSRHEDRILGGCRVH